MSTIQKSVFINILLCFVLSQGLAQRLYLPDKSFVYRDSLAIFWTVTKFRTADDGYSVKIKCMTMFGDNEIEYDDTRDSIILMSFPEEFTKEERFVVDPIFIQHGKAVAGVNVPYILEILKRNEKIEAMKSLVNTAGRIENLRLLADAFEEEKCYVNATQVYERMIYTYGEAGRKSFISFLNRHPEFDRFRGVVERQ